MMGLNSNAPCTGCELGMIAVREISADRDRWRGEALAKRHVEEEYEVKRLKRLETENKRLREENERLKAAKKTATPEGRKSYPFGITPEYMEAYDRKDESRVLSQEQINALFAAMSPDEE